MKKLFLLSFVVCSYSFGDGHFQNFVTQTDLENVQYAIQENIDNDDYVEAGRRRTKGNRGRRKGGWGLR
tara:strand:- start:130 stop:336 length:207 start_codon:yes stop_codon:yes gene_type:complete